MEEEVEFLIDATRERMEAAVKHFEKELTRIRAGRANPMMLDAVRVEYYGTMTPLSQMANINTPDARTLSVQPWEKKMISDIERAIMNANLGFNPQNNGEVIIINIPALTEDRRKDLIKKAKVEAEDARIGIRNARKDANDEIKKLSNSGLSEDLAKDLEAEVQEMTNKFVADVEKLVEKKEKDIMTI
jgi:ribosome recycling factor